MAKSKLVRKGGKGSGNWGHAGRPGKVGGSAPQGGGSAGVSVSAIPTDLRNITAADEEDGTPFYPETIADEYLAEWAETDGYPPTEEGVQEMMDDSGFSSGMMYSGGFVFRDGSVIDIGGGTDHRIIPTTDWAKENIITYRLNQRNELTVRLNRRLRWQQADTLKNLYNDPSAVYYDVYDGFTRVQSDIVDYNTFNHIIDDMVG